MVTIIISLLIFGVLIMVHELGHFAAAKAFDIKIHEFAVGMGPAVYKRQKGETVYSVRALPIGGFVKLEGEDEASDDERAFSKRSPIKRIIVLVSGAFANILVGFLIFLILFSFAQRISIPVVDEVISGSPAQAAGLLPGDRVLELNGKRVNLQVDVTFGLQRNGLKESEFVVLRDGQKINLSITPADDGSGIPKVGFRAKTVDASLPAVIRTAYYNTFFVIRLVYTSVIDMIGGNVSIDQIAGPVGIVNEIGAAARESVLDVLNFAALIAVNLGVMNLLPLPALDGGRVFFILIEMIRRKPIKPEHEGIVHFAGLVLLMLLMVVITYSDIVKLISGR